MTRLPDRDPIRAFHSIVTPDTGRRYHTVKEVQRSADLQIRLLRQAERDLIAFERRYRELTEICTLISEARALVQKRLDAFEDTSEPA
jgi:hypothetical protein